MNTTVEIVSTGAIPLPVTAVVATMLFEDTTAVSDVETPTALPPVVAPTLSPPAVTVNGIF